MSATKDDILAKFRELDKAEQLDVLEELQQYYHQSEFVLSDEPREYRLIGATNPDDFDGLQWLENLEKIRLSVEAYNRGKPVMPSAAELINELREERILP